VAIDPGHGGPDSGAPGVDPRGSVITEKQLTLQLGIAMAEAFRKAGYAVMLTRREDRPVADLGGADLSGAAETGQGERHDLAARVACANHARAAVLLALHFNAFSDPTAGGSTVYYDPDRSFAGRSFKLAQLIDAATVAGLASHGYNPLDRGVAADTNLDLQAILPEFQDYRHLLELGPGTASWTPSAMPAVLIEVLFVTNPQEAGLASDPKVQAALAQAYVRAVGKFLGG
jgi:N-acetylmuramoyl-L-alanine amidase